MLILGISDSRHDRSVCLLENGKIVSAIEEERLTRSKHALFCYDHAMRRANIRDCIHYCLESRGINKKEVDAIYISSLYNKPALHGKSVSHHLAHAASSFFPSNFDEAALLVVDGAGDNIESQGIFETISYGYGTGNRIEILKQISGDSISRPLNEVKKMVNPILATQNSIGTFYKIISIILGMGAFGAGKTMGLASYGTHCKSLPPIEPYFRYGLDGNVAIDNLEIYRILDQFKAQKLNKIKNAESRFQLEANLAFKAQEMTEKIMIEISRFVYKLTKSKNLCLSGGVALNSVANYKILENTPFQKLFIQPAAGDNGLSFGAAYWGYYCDKKQKRVKPGYFNPCLGKVYKEEDIFSSFKHFQNKLTFQRLSETSLYRVAAQYLSEGKIVGWFQGGSEIGPRALGNRSILADPRKAENKDLLNARVKHRESFRPFAPAVLEEYAKDYFAFLDISPYMLLVPPVKQEKRSVIPAVTHVDGSARLQTVSRKQNKKFYQLIHEFHKITGVPLVLNTSFNDRGEPIVETPLEALKFFNSTDMDVLFIHNYLIVKVGGFIPSF